MNPRVEQLSPFGEFCLNQILRLKGPQKFSNSLSEQAWASLRKVLEQHCESEAHVRTVIDQCSMRTEMVSGFDIVEIAKATASAAHAAPNGRCGRCNGTGWVHEIRVQQAGPFRGGKYSYAGKCGCWRTQEMAS